MIRVFDAFSGIGGFRSALERVGGFKIVAWCEIDKFAQKAYRTLYDTGDEQFYENIRNINAGELADFDLLTGGFPCQPFSVCGARKGFADERGDLFFELARIIAWNGVCITAPIIFPKSEREYILQDVLESIVPEKYWLSAEATAKIAGKLNK